MFKILEPGQELGELKYLAYIGEENVIAAENHRDIVACIVGSIYYDSEDELDRWNMRLKASRSLSMQMLQHDKEVVVKSEGVIIKDNYGTDLTDDDYKMNHGADYEIDITTEDAFLKSLEKIELIKIIEN